MGSNPNTDGRRDTIEAARSAALAISARSRSRDRRPAVPRPVKSVTTSESTTGNDTVKMRSVGRTAEEKKSCLPSHSSRHIGIALTSVPAIARDRISSGFIAAISPEITALFGSARNRFLW